MNKVFMFLWLLAGVLDTSTLLADETEPVHRFSANVTVASEYIYRGLAQTNHHPALQGGFDYLHASGLYVGNWNSSSSWIADAGLGAHFSLEMDIYGGYRGQIGDFSFDLGGLYYLFLGYYPDTWKAFYERPDTFEVYGSLGYRWISMKYSHALTDIFGNKNSTGSGYIEANASHGITKAFGVNGHFGYQMIKDLKIASYWDWKIGLSYDSGFAVVGLAYSGTNADETFYFNPINPNLGKGRLLVSLSKTL